MILPIYLYGHPVLKKVAEPIKKDYPQLSELIANMYETMDNADGVGLAAPQVGLSIRLFVVDGSGFKDETIKNFKQVFINPNILEESGEQWEFNEGCLSIPKIREDVSRNYSLVIEYQDEKFVKKKEKFEGTAARIIQHEYDHIEGKLFIERISPLRKMMIKGKLNDILKGEVEVDFPVRLYVPKKGKAVK
jgi:peptide deformylase